MTGKAMGFMVAIIGRFGVGKSLLCKHFSNKGVRLIDINHRLLSMMSDDPDYTQCRACLQGNYHLITDKVPLIKDQWILEAITEYIQQEKMHYHSSVVVLPSFIELDDMVEKKAFEFIVAVDCSRLVQRRYLKQKGIDDSVVSLLLESGYDRPYYTYLATDIFLNSVSLEHMSWTVSQMLKNYELIDRCR